MAEQESRLAIVLDSTGAQRNAEGLAGALQGLTDWGKKAAASAGQTSKATEDEAKALSTLLDRIDPVNAALNRLDEQQQQLSKFRSKGFIDTDTFDVYSRKLDDARNKLSGFNEGMEKGATSAGQYRQAVSQLPMQFTDIFTSLAGGMPLWLVFTQQGGQIADSFGGWGSLLDIIKQELFGMSAANDEASESLSESANGLSENVENGKKFLSFLTPARIAIGGAAGAMALLGTAYYQGSQEQDEFAKSLALTGNLLGTTTGQLADMSRQVASSAGSTTADAANVVNQLVSTGKVAGVTLNTAAEAILNLNDAAGVATEQLVADFNSLAKDPLTAISQLNDKYHFLTLATYNQIKALQDQGNQDEAARVASDAYSAAINQRSDQIKQSLGTLETAWKAVGDGAKWAWDRMLDIGREDSIDEKIRIVTAKLKVVRTAYAREQAQNELNSLNMQKQMQQDASGAAVIGQKNNDNAIAAQKYVNDLTDQTLTKAQKRTKEQDKLTKAIKDGAKITTEQEKALRANIDDKYKDPKTPKAKSYAEDAATRLVDQLRQQQQLLLSQADTGDKIGAQQQELIKWEKQLADIKSKGTLTADQKSLLANADIISAQYEQNAALERQIATREKLLALDKARADISRTIANRESQYATDELFASGGMSQNAQQEYTQRLSLEQSYNDKITQLRQQRATATSDIAREEIDQEIQLQQQAMTTELNMYVAHINRMNAARGSFTAGASRAWQEYQDSAANVSQMSQQLFSNAFSGMEDSLVSFVVNGKASFKDFANSVLSDIARILARQALVGIGTSLAGSLFSAGVGAAAGSAAGAAGSSAGGLGMSTDFHTYAKGGVPGGSTISDYRNGVYDSPQFFKFAKGAGVFGEAGPEAIMPLTRSSDGSLGVRMVGGASNTAPVAAAPQVNVYIQSDGSATSDSTSGYEQFGKNLSGLIRTEYQKLMQRDIQPGGVIWNLNKGRG